MKILVVGVGPWNDVLGGNNIMTNWFTDYDADFANIYVRPGSPCNEICESYFQVTDEDMLVSLFGVRAGKSISLSVDEQKRIQSKQGLHSKDSITIRRAKKIPRSLSNFIKDCIWLFGRIDELSLKQYIEDFNPDIVFCHHVFGINFWRIERLVHKYSNVPMVAFTGDSEVSLLRYSLSPLSWLRQLFLRTLFKRHIKMFSHYWTFCEDQAIWYQSFSGVPCSTLYKCADMPSFFEPKPVGTPVRLVYAGNIIYKRWETLALIADAIESINRDGEKIVLDIYTNTNLTRAMGYRLENRNGTKVHGRVAPLELVEIYKKADIALHIESFTRKYRLATKDSFSTKIVDLMNSTCAIIAICWEHHNGLKYLKREDAAICVSDLGLIEETLRMICCNPTVIQQYAQKAYDCGVRNHTREVIQKQIRNTFEEVIKDSHIRTKF